MHISSWIGGCGASKGVQKDTGLFLQYSPISRIILLEDPRCICELCTMDSRCSAFVHYNGREKQRVPVFFSLFIAEKLSLLADHPETEISNLQQIMEVKLRKTRIARGKRASFIHE